MATDTCDTPDPAGTPGTKPENSTRRGAAPPPPIPAAGAPPVPAPARPVSRAAVAAAFTGQVDFLQLLHERGWQVDGDPVEGHVSLSRRGPWGGRECGLFFPETGRFVVEDGYGFQRGRAYTPFAYLARQDYDGDGAACAQALVEQGYGPPEAAGGETAPESDPPGQACWSGPRVFTAAELLAREMPPPRWAVEGLLPEGLSLLAGKPKQGKSWMSLGLAVAITGGGRALGRLPATEGEVLYLALEDTARRLKDRLQRLLAGAPPSSRLTVTTEWPRLGDGGLNALEEWLTARPETRLVVIDTLARVRPARAGNGDRYAEDYQVMAEMKAVADRHQTAILLVHHLRKMSADDPFDTVSGTTALTGAADAALVLQRRRGQAEAGLFLTGRDVEERELALHWDAARCTWTLTGTAEEARRSQERTAILQVLAASAAPLTPKEVAERLQKPQDAVRRLMWRMEKQGELVSPARGRYSPPDHTDHTDHTDHSDHSGHSGHIAPGSPCGNAGGSWSGAPADESGSGASGGRLDTPAPSGNHGTTSRPERWPARADAVVPWEPWSSLPRDNPDHRLLPGLSE